MLCEHSVSVSVNIYIFFCLVFKEPTFLCLLFVFYDLKYLFKRIRAILVLSDFFFENTAIEKNKTK